MVWVLGKRSVMRDTVGGMAELPAVIRGQNGRYILDLSLHDCTHIAHEHLTELHRCSAHCFMAQEPATQDPFR
ncbi:MAG: hypothetical protein QGH33_08065 [Pirellulaceae bacterium]|jgi:hypothetical protein|nr:hypothetical protein [Pirellulaceae bacterium]